MAMVRSSYAFFHLEKELVGISHSLGLDSLYYIQGVQLRSPQKSACDVHLSRFDTLCVISKLKTVTLKKYAQGAFIILVNVAPVRSHGG